MKKKTLVRWLIAAAMVVAMVPLYAVAQTAAPPAEENYIDIPDPNFRTVLNDEIGQETDDTSRPADSPITQAEMESLRNIYFGDEASVTDITGIQYAKNLNTLEVTGTVKGLEEISKLENLVGLSIYDNESINDLAFLGNKPHLTSFKVASCPNLTSLSGMTYELVPALYNLYVGTCQSFYDLSALSDQAFPSLGQLTLFNCRNITDITPLKDYTSLTSLEMYWVAIRPENCEDYRSTIASLTSLTQLSIRNCRIIDVDARVMLPSLSQLTHLDLSNNLLSSLNFLNRVSADLITLKCRSNFITDLNPVTRFPNLTELDFEANWITNFSVISKLPNVTFENMGTTLAPAQFFHGIGNIFPVEVINGTLTIPNPYVGVDGQPIPFTDAVISNAVGYTDDYTISYNETTNEITLENVTGDMHFYTTYTVSLPNDQSAIFRLYFNIRTTEHQHTWSEPTYTWAEDGSSCTATRVCQDASTHVETVTAVISQEQTKAPTCTQMGETTYTATFAEDWANSQTLTLADVEPVGHAWGQPTYTWAEDGSSCTASRVCENDATHVETVTAVISQEQTKAPTCTQAGETTYTATFAVDWAVTQTLTLADVPQLPHSSNGAWHWDETNHFHICEVGGEHIDAAAHTFQWVTDSQAGERYQQCTVCGYQLSAEALPTPSATPQPNQPPQTGDTASVLPWASALVVGFALLPALMAWKRRAN